jgi:hypothetical protein
MSAWFHRELSRVISGPPSPGSASPPTPSTSSRVQPLALHDLQTEQSNPATEEIDTLSTLDMCRLINAEDRRVASAVEEITPAISQAIDDIVVHMSRGGRLLYMGAGTSGR